MNTRKKENKNEDDIIIDIEQDVNKYDLEHVVPNNLDQIASYLSYNPDLINLGRVSKKMNALVKLTGAATLAKEIEEQINIYQSFHPILNKMLSSFKFSCWLVERFLLLSTIGGGGNLLLSLIVLELIHNSNPNFRMNDPVIASIFMTGATITNGLFFAKKIYDRFGFFKQEEQALFSEMRESLSFPVPPLYEVKDKNEAEPPSSLIIGP